MFPRSRAFILRVLTLGLLLTGATELRAQYTLEVTSTTGAPGSTATVAVLLDNDAGAGGVPLTGWSFGLCNDITELTALSGALGAAAAPLNPNFVEIGLETGGITCGVIVSFALTTTLAPGLDLELLTVDYDLIGAGGTIATVSPCNTLGVPPVDILVVEDDADEIIPAGVPGTITIEAALPTASFACPTVTPAAGTAVLPITLTHGGSDGTVGFSFGLAFDDTLLVPTSLVVGADLQAIRNGAGPAFFGANLAPVGGGGVILGVLNDFGQPPALLPLGTDLEVAILTTTIAPAAPSTGTLPVAFSQVIGDPPTVLEVVTRVSGNTVAVTPTTTDGGVDLTVRFVRGDANGDGAVSIVDVMASLEAIFTAQSPPTCPDQLDADDDGALGILDAVFLLEFLFVGGVTPAAPFPTCGPDASDTDALDCASSAAACN